MSPALFAVAALLVGAASIFASALWQRSTAYCVLVAAMLALWWTALGHPRPSFFGAPDGVLIAYQMNWPESIVLMVLPEGQAEAMLWRLPWSAAVESMMNVARNSADGSGGTVMIRGRGALLGRHVVIMVKPPAPMPAKTRP